MSMRIGEKCPREFTHFVHKNSPFISMRSLPPTSMVLWFFQMNFGHTVCKRIRHFLWNHKMINIQMRLQNANGPIAIIGPVRFLSSIAVHILTGHLIDCNERRSLAKNNTAGSKIIIRRQSLQIEMILLGIWRISMHVSSTIVVILTV